MKRIKLVVAYDGTRYCGWQWQPNGLSIEEVLKNKLEELLGEEITVIGASRTDSGVHAWGNIAVFDTETRIPGDKICFALNQKLPEDIVIQSSEEVPLTWHPRRCNSIKTYEYRILNRKMPFPAERLTSWFVYYPLDTDKMQQAANDLLGEHDFKSFCSTKTQAEETVRTLYAADVLREGDVVTLRLKGNGFLTHMVRIIAGTLVKVGLGIYPPEKVKEILKARNRREAGNRAPAQGLTLISIEEVKGLTDEDTVTGEDWDYTVYQKEIAQNGRAYIWLRRCEDRDLDRNVIRLTKHAFQNRAKEVYVCDAAGRLPHRRKYGDYRLIPAAGEEFSGRMEEKEPPVFPAPGDWYFVKDEFVPAVSQSEETTNP